MIKRRRIKFTIPEYREKKSAYLKMGYVEMDYHEKGVNAYVDLEINETPKRYRELKKLEVYLNKKGPTFWPILILVSAAFALLVIFTIIAARAIRDGIDFDFTANAIAFIVPAGILLLADTIYTFFYFKINQRIMDRYNPTIEEFDEMVDKIRNS